MGSGYLSPPAILYTVSKAPSFILHRQPFYALQPAAYATGSDSRIKCDSTSSGSSTGGAGTSDAAASSPVATSASTSASASA